MNRLTIPFIFLCVLSPALAAGTFTSEEKASVQQQIREALTAEQEAFTTGGCVAALPYFADREQLFVSNGRSLPSLDAMRKVCSGRPARWAGAETRETLEHLVHATSPSTGYTVSRYRTPDGPTATQIITKIWEKAPEGWRIVHAHESVRSVPD